MEELYAIMREFLEVQYNQESLLSFLKAAEAAFTAEKQEEARLVANGTKYYVEALHGELKTAIGRMDCYIAENAKKKR